MVNHSILEGTAAKLDNNKTTNIRVMVIAETLQQRQAFTDTLTKFGLTLVGCLAPSEIIHNQIDTSKIEADIWLVDSQYDDALYHRLEDAFGDTDLSDKALASRDTLSRQRLMLVGFEQAPQPNEMNLYAKWQRKLRRKLASMLSLPQPELKDSNESLSKDNSYKPWQYILLLVASEQDNKAVAEFLDCLPSDLPVAMIVAQPTDSDKVHALPQQMSEHNHWQSQVISVSLNMQAGHCYIAPPQPQVVYDSTGRAIITDQQWSTANTPCLPSVIENCSDAFGEQLIGVLFSNVKMDRPLDIGKLEENNSQIWQQTTEMLSSRAQRMQTETKLPQYRGSSLQLAHYLTAYINHQQSSV